MKRMKRRSLGSSTNLSSSFFYSTSLILQEGIVSWKSLYQQLKKVMSSKVILIPSPVGLLVIQNIYFPFLSLTALSFTSSITVHRTWIQITNFPILCPSKLTKTKYKTSKLIRALIPIFSLSIWTTEATGKISALCQSKWGFVLCHCTNLDL